ncbi:MAG: TIGR04141 family sporadically distributed protein [Candidatus Gracilibacteria bacterium]|jgi:uncharacterized protein (TIGR04141 family)
MSPRKKANEKESCHLKIFLLKEDVKTDDEIFKTPNALSTLEISDVGQLFYAQSFPKQPKWLELFSSLPEEDQKKLFNSSTKAVLITETQGRKFALAFGYGRSLIKDGAVEPRFGLKVVLNTVNKDSIRSIDKTSIGSVPLHSREQLSRSGTTRDFGINVDEDLIRAVTGISKYTEFGKTISGNDELAISVPFEISDIKDILSKCLMREQSKDYLESFPWIDQVQEIRDKFRISILNEKLIEQINNNQTDKIWLAVPEIVEWADVAGFKYKENEEEPIFNDLSLHDFLETMRETTKLTFEYIKTRKIFCIKSSDDSKPIEWSVSQCIYAEIDDGGEKFILTNNSWYKVDTEYVSKVDTAYKNVSEYSGNLPSYDVSVFGGTGKDKGEAGYNKICCDTDSVNRFLMDGGNDKKKLIYYGGGHSQIEFCDIFTKKKEIIHVKRYGGSSSLSHLFQQGLVSGEMFRQDQPFRILVNDKLGDGFKIDDPKVPPQQDEYEIVFVIINNSNRELDLPFFSKITLLAATRRLNGFGYKVSLKKIKSVLPPVSETEDAE